MRWGDKGSTEAASHLEKTKDAKEIVKAVTESDENANSVKREEKSSLCVSYFIAKLHIAKDALSNLYFLYSGWLFHSNNRTVCVAGKETPKKRQCMVREGSVADDPVTLFFRHLDKTYFCISYGLICDISTPPTLFLMHTLMLSVPISMVPFVHFPCD